MFASSSGPPTATPKPAALEPPPSAKVVDSTAAVALPKSPEASQALRALHAVRDAALGLRRAQLTRLVQGVVVVSGAICVIALGRAIFAPSPAEGAASLHTATQSRDTVLIATLVKEDVDQLEERSARASAHEDRRATAHTRAHRWKARPGGAW
jgi:hypothetical protein